MPMNSLPLSPLVLLAPKVNCTPFSYEFLNPWVSRYAPLLTHQLCFLASNRLYSNKMQRTLSTHFKIQNVCKAQRNSDMDHGQIEIVILVVTTGYSF